MNGSAAVWLEGGCHCAAVRFRVRAAIEPTLAVIDCNCTMCTKKGILHLIVPACDFQMLCDESALGLYQFNTRVARHYFCKACGISPFYVPRSNPDGMDVNARCLDMFSTGLDLAKLSIEPFDGQNWEDRAAELAHLSVPSTGAA